MTQQMEALLMDDLTSAELVERAALGDQDSWNQITERYSNLLWSIARSYRLSTTDAEDVVQTTWLRLVENLGRIREPERLAGWLATTARNECLSHVRRMGREVVVGNDSWTIDTADDFLPPLDTGLLEQERDVELWRSFEQLSAQCQALLRVLMATDPGTYAEVAEAFGMPIGSIGPTRMRCLERLRRIAEESEYSFDHETESRLR